MFKKRNSKVKHRSTSLCFYLYSCLLYLGLVWLVVIDRTIITVVAKLTKSRVLQVVLLLQFFVQNRLLRLLEQSGLDWGLASVGAFSYWLNWFLIVGVVIVIIAYWSFSVLQIQKLLMRTKSPSRFIMYHASSGISRIRVLTSAPCRWGIVNQAIIKVNIALICVCSSLLLIIVMTFYLFEFVLFYLNPLGGRQLKRSHCVVKDPLLLLCSHYIDSVQIWFYISWNFWSNNPTFISNCGVHQHYSSCSTMMILVYERRSLASDSIHNILLIATGSRIIPLWVQLINHVSPVLWNPCSTSCICP